MRHKPSVDCPTSPRAITWTSVRNQATFNAVRSKDDVIRFRVVRGQTEVILDADWYATPWQLSRETCNAIFQFCATRATSVGGGKSGLRIKTTTQQAREVQDGLSQLLSKPESWIRLTVRPKFSQDAFQTFGDESAGDWDFAAMLSQPKFDESAAEQIAARCALVPKKRGLQFKPFSPLSKLGQKLENESEKSN
jgi:hypothetical protein